MKHIFKFLLLLACSTMVMNVFAQSADNEDEVIKIDESNYGAYRPNEVIVHFKEDGAVQMRAPRRAKFQTTAVSAVDQLFATLGVDSVEELMPCTGTKPMPKRVRTFNGKDIEPKPLGKLYRLKLAENSNQNVFQAIEQLKQLEEVDYAEPNYLVFALGAETALEDEISLPIYSDKKAYISKNKQNATNDSAIYVQEPLYSQQWGIEAINLHKLWNKPKITTKRPVIAILDTGVDIEHPDLAANIWTNETEANGVEGQDDDVNGFNDDIHGWDFINQTGVIRDFNGHGTHCAGIAGAVGDNGIGITGANPDALIMPVTIMQSDGTGDVATTIKGIDYAISNGADLLSMSFGSYSYSLAEEQTLGRAYANAVLVAAAGNNSALIDATKGNGPCYLKSIGGASFPAAFSFVLGVISSESNGCESTFTNFDPHPVFSSYREDQLYNYELRAPGTAIYSTFPNGRYKSMNGTSMACPMVAGALSRLLSTKEYDNKELLFGDLIHTRQNNMAGDIDIAATYDITDADRKPTLWLVGQNLLDTAGGDGDGIPDAGEIMELYPILRNDWGLADSIHYWLKLGFYNDGDWVDDDTALLTFLTDTANFGWTLSGYAKSVAKNPLRFQISSNCPDRRHINFTIFITGTNLEDTLKHYFVLEVENGVEIGGMITDDMTLYPNVHYIVTRPIAVAPGVTLTIKPGTVLKFKDNTGLSCIINKTNQDQIDWAKSSILIANGKPDSLIVFMSYDPDGKFDLNLNSTNNVNKLSYCKIDNCNGDIKNSVLDNCIRTNSNSDGGYGNVYYVRSNIYGNQFRNIDCKEMTLTNVANNISDCRLSERAWSNGSYKVSLEKLDRCNIYPFTITTVEFVSSIPVYNTEYLLLKYYASAPTVIRTDAPSYFGSSKESIVRQYVQDIESGYGYGYFDLSNMLTQPVREAHGVVWKVVIDGFDAQDEFEQLPPLGVGRHKCEVYFNRPMETAIKPLISYGVRSPYTQHSIEEDGSWSADSTIYTAYFTIDGKTISDGLNRIYVADAQDDEHFEIPIEDFRFNMQIAATGSLSTGLMAEAGLGKITLTWETDEEDFEDLLGYNIYRWTHDTIWYNRHYDASCSCYTYDWRIDTICINESLIDASDTSYIDYDVVPGKDYYYVIRQMTTSLESYDLSNIVVARPLTAIKGDANGSMSVDVADVITEVNYITHQNPQPFIFEAADINYDNTINIFDVVGTINIIRHPQTNSQAIQEGHAIYYIENGILYVESDAVLGGVQFTFVAEQPHTFTPLEALNGFEMVSEWTDEDSYLFMAYSMSGKTIGVGKNALLQIGDAELTSIALSDTQGHNVKAIPRASTALDGTVFMPNSSKYIQDGNFFIKLGDRIYNAIGTLIK